MQFASVPDSVPENSQEAWETYLQAIDAARARVLNSRWAKTAVDRAQALYYIQMLQAFGFNIYTAPRQSHPNFYVHSIFMPFEYGFGAPCPDFFYRWTFLDGTRTYRLWGKLGATRWVELQAQRGFWGDPDQTRLGNWDFDDFHIEADGSFEIIASARKHDGNWMQLDPTARNITVIVRDAFYDWAGEVGLEIHVEALDLNGDEPIAHSEDEMNRRLRAIAYLTQHTVEFFLAYNERIVDGAGFNQFYVTPMESSNDVGGNPRAAYMQMLYDIQPGEALIIETEIPDARFWSLQLNDVWWQTTDYVYHQSSLNGHQAQADQDGRVRMVLSFEDPGVPNWIDPVDYGVGVAQWRWYLTDRMPTPSVRKVPVAEVRRHLPPETPTITAQQRSEQINRRKRAVLDRFGF